MENPTHKPHQDYYLGEDELAIDEVIEKLIVKYGGDFEVLKAYFQEIITKELLEAFNEFIDIQCADGTWNFDPYMHGMANGMIFMKYLVDDKDPVFLEAPAVWSSELNTDSPPIAAEEEGFTDVVEETLSDPFAVTSIIRRRIAMNELEISEEVEEALYEHFRSKRVRDVEVATFEEMGVLGAEGVVLIIGDQEFQITVVRSG